MRYLVHCTSGVIDNRARFSGAARSVAALSPSCCCRAPAARAPAARAATTRAAATSAARARATSLRPQVTPLRLDVEDFDAHELGALPGDLVADAELGAVLHLHARASIRQRFVHPL